jgi:hypothetical protein
MLNRIEPDFRTTNPRYQGGINDNAAEAGDVNVKQLGDVVLNGGRMSDETGA